jgi:hypothetical protein
MPSSTSASNRSAATCAFVILPVLLLVYMGALETVTRVGFPRINHFWHRIAADQGTARSLRPASSNGASSVLIVGNSLLLWAVDRESLEKDTLPAYSAAVLPIENTNYLDWYFGLRRLFAEGSRPAVVGVCLSTRQLISAATYGEPFAHSMMQEKDLLHVKRAAHLDNTMTSNYFFAGFSSWLGFRGEVHNWLLQKLMPNAGELTRYFPGKTPPMPPTDVVLANALPRLRSLNELLIMNGARFFLLVPPTFDVHDSSITLRAEAAKEGILVIVPFQPGEMPVDGFQEDGFHLNAEGASRFTERLGSILPQSLSQSPHVSGHPEN